jgi:hypothetical protein
MTKEKMTMKMMSNMKTNVRTMNKIKEMMIRMMMLLDIFFNFSLVVHFFAYLKGGRLGIGSLNFKYGGSLLVIERSFKTNICCVHRS